MCLSDELIKDQGCDKKLVNFFNVNLCRESDDKKLNSFDTYNCAPMHCMQFVHKQDGSWGKKSFVDPIKVDVSLDEVSPEEDDDNYDIEGGIQNKIAINYKRAMGQE